MVKRRASKSGKYFFNITQSAIIAYNGLEKGDPRRDRIYSRFIQFPLEKMTESIYHKGKFYHIPMAPLDVQYACIAHLVDNLHKFNPNHGGKAYSYFTRCVYNWMIIENSKAYAKKTKHKDVDAIDKNRNILNEVARQDTLDEKKEFMDLFVEYVDTNMTKYFKRQNDLQVAEAVLYIFKTRQNIENYNKKALYILIKERAKIEKTQYITKVVNILKKLYGEMYLNYQKTGSIHATKVREHSFYR